MTKTLLAIAAAILTVTTVFASAAEAGYRVRLGFGGPLPYFTAHGNSGVYKGRRAKPRKHHVRRKPKGKVEVTRSEEPAAEATAEAEPATEAAAKSAVSTSSSIAVAKAASTDEEAAEPDAPAPPEPGATLKTDCKKFFPSVGMTLTVPCE